MFCVHFVVDMFWNRWRRAQTRKHKIESVQVTNIYRICVARLCLRWQQPTKQLKVWQTCFGNSFSFYTRPVLCSLAPPLPPLSSSLSSNDAAVAKPPKSFELFLPPVTTTFAYSHWLCSYVGERRFSLLYAPLLEHTRRTAEWNCSTK